MKTSFIKGTTVCIIENGTMTNFQTNLSHAIEAEVGDTFAINWGKSDQRFKLVETDGFMIVAEELEEVEDEK